MKVQRAAEGVRLQRRLQIMLIVPLVLLGLFNAWQDYRSADSAAQQQDKQLLHLLPLLADSIVAVGAHSGDPPVLLLAAPVEEFLSERKGLVVYKVYTPQKDLLHGDERLPFIVPQGDEPEFSRQHIDGVAWRVVAQRMPSVAGNVIVEVADASNPWLRWMQQVLVKVLLPHLLLMGAAVAGVSLLVRSALKPLRELTLAVAQRSPRDLSSIHERGTPEEIRPLIAALNRLFALVSAQAESQRRFVADAAHQLRTPLAGLQAHIEALAASAGAAAAPSTGMVQLPASELEHLRAAARRASQLMHQLLSLSRAESDQLEHQHMQRVSLKSLCEALLEAYWDKAQERGIDLGLDVQQDLNVLGHALWLHELLSNLLDNALRYSAPGGSVTLRCALLPNAQPPQAFAEVEDDGCGIAPQQRERVFERFYRIGGTQQPEGTGLGLAIAREIAHRHHSVLQLLDSTQSQGLRARLLFAPDLLLPVE